MLPYSPTVLQLPSWKVSCYYTRISYDYTLAHLGEPVQRTAKSAQRFNLILNKPCRRIKQLFLWNKVQQQFSPTTSWSNIPRLCFLREASTDLNHIHSGIQMRKLFTAAVHPGKAVVYWQLPPSPPEQWPPQTTENSSFWHRERCSHLYISDLLNLQCNFYQGVCFLPVIVSQDKNRVWFPSACSTIFPGDFEASGAHPQHHSSSTEGELPKEHTAETS